MSIDDITCFTLITLSHTHEKKMWLYDQLCAGDLMLNNVMQGVKIK